MTRRRISPTAALVMLVGLTGACATEAPTATDARANETGGEGTRHPTAAANARWGDGRAIAAATATDGTIAIVTTVEVHLVPPVEGDGAHEAVTLDDHAIRRHPLVAISGDAALVATVDIEPPRITWYDTVASAAIAGADLPAGAQPSGLHFLRDTHTLLVETDAGPIAWPTPPTDDESPVTTGLDPVMPDDIAGPSALLADGGALIPLLGTRSFVVLRGDAMIVAEVDLPDGAAVQRATTPPSGDVIVIEAAVGTSEFDRPDHLVVLDSEAFAVTATIPLGRDVPGDGWAVTDEVIAVEQGNRIMRWDLTGSPLAPIDTGGELGVGRLVALAGGLVTIRSDGSITFWPSDTAGSVPVELLPGGRVIGPVVTSADGRHLTTVDGVGRVRSWSGPDGAAHTDIREFETGELTGVTVGSDGSIAAGTTLGRIVLADSALATSEAIESADGAVRVDSVAFRPGSNELASGRAERRSDLAFDDTLTLWRLTDRTVRFRTGGEAEDVAGCAFFYHRLHYSADGAWLATASHDRTVGILDAETGAEVHRLPARTGSILDLAFTPDGDRLVVSADDNTIEVWDTADWSIATTIASTAGGYSALAALPHDRIAVVADVTGGLTRIDLATGDAIVRFDAVLPPRPTAVAASPDGTLVASPVLDDAIGVWSAATGEQLAVLTGHTDDVTGVAFSPDGATLVSASADGTLRTWSLISP